MTHTPKCPNCLTPANLKASHADLLAALEKLESWANGIIDNLETADPMIGPQLRRKVLLPARAAIKAAKGETQ